MPKPYVVHTTAWFKLKAKDVKKNDRFYIAGTEMTVLTNRKRFDEERTIRCSSASSNTIFTLTLVKNQQLTVTRHESKRFPKNR